MDTVIDSKNPNWYVCHAIIHFLCYFRVPISSRSAPASRLLSYAVITEWESKSQLNTWLASDLCKEVSEKLNTVLDSKPTNYREFREAEEDIFLL